MNRNRNNISKIPHANNIGVFVYSGWQNTKICSTKYSAFLANNTYCCIQQTIASYCKYVIKSP